MRTLLHGSTERRVLRNNHWVKIPIHYAPISDCVSRVSVVHLEVLKKLGVKLNYPRRRD